MSLRVKNLNGDSSFLLIFSPSWITQPDPQGSLPGSFVCLVDPWLAGDSKVWSSKFAVAKHVTESCVHSLAELPDPDLILISQDKTDHCHAETLMELPPDTGATIVATPAAAKKIRSWRHFDPLSVQPLKRFDEKRDNTIFRISIPPLSISGTPGEVTVALLAPKRDLTGLHNALAITYRPPSSALSLKTGSFVNLPTIRPTSPPSPIRPKTPLSHPLSPNLALPGHKEKTLSVIYSPHGVSYSIIEQYATSHLLASSALPITALFHSFNVLSNPWYLGGNIAAGTPGGIDIARKLFPRVWISAHDEEKDNRGMSVKSLKTKRYAVEDVRASLDEALGPAKKYNRTLLLAMDAGEDYLLPVK